MASAQNGNSTLHANGASNEKDLNYLISPQLLNHYRSHILPQCHQTTIRKRDFLPHYRARSYPLYIGDNFIKLGNKSKDTSSNTNNTPNSVESPLDNDSLSSSNHQNMRIVSDYIVNEKTAHKYSKVTDAFQLADEDKCICGHGTYGVVFRAYSKPTGKDVAVKGIRCDDGYWYHLDDSESKDNMHHNNNSDSKTDNHHNSNDHKTDNDSSKSSKVTDKIAMLHKFMTPKLAIKKKVKQFNDQIGVPHTAIQELQTLQRLQHKNIVNLIDVVSNRTFDCVPCDVSSSYYLRLMRLVWSEDNRPYKKKYRHVVLPQQPKDQDEEKSRKIIASIFSEMEAHDARALEGDIRDKLYLTSEKWHAKRCSENKKDVPVFYMTFEYMDRDLSDELKRLSANNVTMKVSVAKYYFKQIMQGMRHIHQCGIIHRDIKPSNVLINYSGEVKLCDFGLAFENNSTHSSTTRTNRVVTSWYRPPEILLGETRYSYAIDIWSCCCVLLEMLTNVSPFQSQTSSELDLFRQICNLCGEPNKDNWPNVELLPWFSAMMQHLKKSKPAEIEAKDQIFYRYTRCILTDPFLKYHINECGLRFIDFMLILDPAQRPSAEEVLCHPYFRQEPLPQYIEIKNPYKIDVQQIQEALERDPLEIYAKQDKERNKEDDTEEESADKTPNIITQESASLNALHSSATNHKSSRSKYQYQYKYNNVDWENNGSEYNNQHPNNGHQSNMDQMEAQSMFNRNNGYNQNQNNLSQNSNNSNPYTAYDKYNNNNNNQYSNGYNQYNNNRNNHKHRGNYKNSNRGNYNRDYNRGRYNSNRGRSLRGNGRRGRGSRDGYRYNNRETRNNRGNRRRNTRFRPSSSSPVASRRYSHNHRRTRSKSKSKSKSRQRTTKSRSKSRQRTTSRNRSKSRSRSKSKSKSRSSSMSRSRSRSRSRSHSRTRSRSRS